MTWLKSGDLVINSNHSILIESEPWTIQVGIVTKVHTYMREAHVQWSHDQGATVYHQDELKRVKLELVDSPPERVCP